MYADVRRTLFQVLPGDAETGQVYLGLLLFVLVSLALRRGLGHLAPIGVVILAGLGLEVADVAVLGQSARGALPDLLHFVLAPLFLFGMARFRLLKA
ncbi:hypothetical protein [Zavarzinia compransoris]|uniref:Uncharacterized protein n=1 Tax=Zavarzinia compransoris TaxID=1264899 RepID=A0A317E7D6_9PROT|nr:hypothetical protein [Zavarzinia compransoris]PWR22194.1 hypothetical protein DKG75_09515 [Zavarzinia compransoris]TDP47053.1 hypothetical protein DES42_103221 [Zavarzinia compransoris]